MPAILLTCAGERALEYASSLKRLSRRIWGVILGPCTFFVLQERGSLSTFFTIYPFIRKNYCTSVPLWNSAREELVCFLGLMYFCRVRGGSPGVQLLLLLMPAPLDMPCVLGTGLSSKLPSTDVFWNEPASCGTPVLHP